MHWSPAHSKSYPTMMQPNYELKTKTPRPTKSSKNRIQQSTSIQKCASKCIFSHLFFTLRFGKLQKTSDCRLLSSSVVCQPRRVVCLLVAAHLCRFSKAPKSDSLWRFSSSPLPTVLQTSFRRTKKSFNSACDGLDGFNMRAGLLSLQHFSAFFVCRFRFMHIFIASASEHEKINLVCALNLNAKPNIALHSSLSCKCKKCSRQHSPAMKKKTEKVFH